METRAERRRREKLEKKGVFYPKDFTPKAYIANKENGEIKGQAIEYDEYRHPLMDIYLPDGNSIKKGETFLLKDAYVEDGNLVLGIDIDGKVYEGCFKSDIKNHKDLREHVEEITMPYQGFKGMEKNTIIFIP